MGTQQVQQPPLSQGRKRLPWKQVRRVIYTLVAITLLFFIVGAIIWILIALGIIHGPVFDKLLVIFNGLGGATIAVLAFFGIFQFILSLIPNQTESPSTAPSSTPSTSTSMQPAPPSGLPANKTSYLGIVGLPPPTDPKTIQQREKSVKEVYDRLIQPGITAIALTGIGGVGKSTLAALVYNYEEAQRRTGKGPFTAEPLWLRIDPAVTLIDLTGTLVEAMGKPLPDLSGLSPENQAVALFNALNGADKPRLVILDQFENLLDWQTGHALPDRPGVGEWLDAINSQQCTCRVLLTSRPFPQGTHEYPPTCLQEYPLGGLSEAEGIELLRKQGVKGTEEELRTAVKRCAGHALSLTLLASLLRTRGLSMTTLLKDPAYAQIWSGNIARNLLDSIYKQQLNELPRKLLLAFSVYREPVPLDATHSIIDDTVKVAEERLERGLDALLAQHLVQASGEGRYQVHVIVATYVHDHFVEGDESANRQAVLAAHAKAAHYYLQQATKNCPPREKRRGISDVHDLLEAIWQYIQAEQWQVAYDLMRQEGIFDDLERWGGNAILLELYLLLPLDKWHPERSQGAEINNSLGWIYYDLGKMKEALKHYDEALRIWKEIRDRGREGSILNNLGLVYNMLGQNEKAQEYYDQALTIQREERNRGEEGRVLNNLGEVYQDLGKNEDALKCYVDALRIRREIGDRRGEGETLSNLGLIYKIRGQNDEALKYYKQALSILREIGDRKRQGTTLNNLGAVYKALGQKQEALGYYEQALKIRREVGDRRGEGTTLWNIGAFYFEQHRNDIALACFLLAKGIYEEVQSPNRDVIQSWIDGLRRKVGEKRFAALLARVEPEAYQIVERALREGL